MRLRLTAALFAAALTSATALAAPSTALAASDPISSLLARTADVRRDGGDAQVTKQTIGSNPLTGWQCAQFARLFTGIDIFGDAWTWWEKAAGKYARGFTPQAGSVLVFKPYGPMSRGHVSVVSQVLTDRIIQVTHANWSLIGGRRGQVEKDVTVVDVSQKGDWSQVKVWYDPTGDLGRTVYPTYGFVYKTAATTAGNVIDRAASVLGLGGNSGG